MVIAQFGRLFGALNQFRGDMEKALSVCVEHHGMRLGQVRGFTRILRNDQSKEEVAQHTYLTNGSVLRRYLMPPYLESP